MGGSLALNRVGVTCDLNRQLDVFLQENRGQSVAYRTDKKEYRHCDQAGGHEDDGAELHSTHSQVEEASWPVPIEATHKCGEGIGQGTNLEQERDLDKYDQQTLHNAHYGECNYHADVKEVCYSQRNAQEYIENGDPLAIYQKVALAEIIQKAAAHV